MAAQPFQQTFLGSYYRNRFIKINLVFSLIANIILWLFLVWQARNFSDLIFLHYNIYFGIDLLGPWHQIFFLPLFGLGFLVINLLISLIFYQRERILSYFLVGTASLLQFIFILAGVFITLVN
ncbi:MAG: hypothetical protein WC675_01685 [Patescibacteria group bacterium]|jgi:hypothetical protein